MADAPNENARKILTVVGTANWVFLATPFQSKKYPEQPPKYKIQTMMNPNTPDGTAELAKVKTSQRAVAAAVWEDKAEFMMKKCQASDSLILHDGDLQDDDNAKGLFILNAANKKPVPTVVTLSGGALQQAIQADPNADWAKAVVAKGLTAANVPTKPGHPMFPYSGCRVATMFELYIYNKESFVAQLMGVQFLEHGKAFTGGGGGRIARVDEFGINPIDADAAIPMQQDAGAANGLM